MSVATCTSASFALGCVKRSLGGMKSGVHLAGIVSILQQALKTSSPAVHIWALHALHMTIDAAG